MQELHMYMEDRIMIRFLSVFIRSVFSVYYVCTIMFPCRRLKSDVLDQLPSKRRQMVLLYCRDSIAASITVLLMSSCMCAGTVGPLPDQGKEQRMERNETGTG